MKKTGFLLFLTLIVFSTCKKEKDKPAASPAPGPSVQAVPKIKSTRTLNYVQDSLQSIQNTTYEYNTDGQISSMLSTDSMFFGMGWSVQIYNQTYSYTSFNKIRLISFSPGFGTYTTEYIYDSNEKLIAQHDIGQSDTLKYTYSGNQIIGEITSNMSNFRSYYSENLDSTLYTNTFNFSSYKIIYKRNSKIDAGSLYLNQFLGIVSNKHELVQEIQTTNSIQGSTTTTKTISRTYNSNGFPKEVTVEEQGGNNKSVTHYTYL